MALPRMTPQQWRNENQVAGGPAGSLPLDALAWDLRKKLGDDPEGLAALLVGDRTLPGLTRPRIAELVERGWAPEDAASLAAEELRRGRVEPDEILLRRWAYQIFAEVRNLGSGAAIEPEEHLLQLRRRAVSERNTRPVRFGIPRMDECFTGIFPGEMLSVVAPQGSGKTALALNLTETALRDGLRVLFISADMPAPVILVRRLQRRLHWPEWRVRAALQDGARGDVEALQAATAAMRKADAGRFSLLGADTRGSCCDERVLSVAMRIAPDLLVVDYLTLLRGRKDRSDLETVGRVLPRLLAAADRLGFALVTLSQMSRDAKRDQRAGETGGHGKGGGLIEERATVEVELLRYEDEAGTAHIAELTKNRRGPNAAFRLDLRLPEIAFAPVAIPVMREKRRKSPGYTVQTVGLL